MVPPTFPWVLVSVPPPRLRWPSLRPGPTWGNGPYRASNFAQLGHKAENEYVEVNSGIMDQFASACGIKDKLLWLDCRSLEWGSLPLPDGIDIIVADTTIRRQLTASAYNDRRRSCEAAVAVLSLVLPGITSLRDVSVEQFNTHCHRLPPPMKNGRVMWSKKSNVPNRQFRCWKMVRYANLVG